LILTIPSDEEVLGSHRLDLNRRRGCQGLPRLVEAVGDPGQNLGKYLHGSEMADAGLDLDLRLRDVVTQPTGVLDGGEPVVLPVPQPNPGGDVRERDLPRLAERQDVVDPTDRTLTQRLRVRVEEEATQNHIPHHPLVGFAEPRLDQTDEATRIPLRLFRRGREIAE